MQVNKRELAPLLGVTIPTLDRWLTLWADFPVVTRGGPGAQWSFEAEAACDFVARKREADQRAAAERANRLAQMALPLFDRESPVPLGGATTAAEALTLARLRRIQREEAVANGRLVDAQRATDLLADTFGRLGRGLRSALRQILEAHRLPAGLVREIETAFAEHQRQAVVAIGRQFGEPVTPAVEIDPPRVELRLVAG